MNEEIPECLKCRPPYFIKKCMEGLQRLSSQFTTAMVQESEAPKIYKVNIN